MADMRLIRFGPESMGVAAAVAFEAFIVDSMSLAPEIPLRRIASLLCKSAIRSPAGAAGAFIEASLLGERNGFLENTKKWCTWK